MNLCGLKTLGYVLYVVLFVCLGSPEFFFCIKNAGEEIEVKSRVKNCGEKNCLRQSARVLKHVRCSLQTYRAIKEHINTY